MKKLNIFLISLLLLLLIFIELFYYMNHLRYVTNNDKKILGLEKKIVLFANLGNGLYTKDFDLYILDSGKIERAHYYIGNEGSNEHRFYGAIYQNYFWGYLIIFKIICHSIIAYLCLKLNKKNNKCLNTN